MKRPLVIALVAVSVAVALGVGIALRLKPPRGYQFVQLGGLDITFKIKTEGLKGDEPASVTDDTARVLQKRFDPNGRKGVIITTEPDYRVRVRLPGLSTKDMADAVALATRTGRLELRLVAKDQDAVKIAALRRGESVAGYAFCPYTESAQKAVPGRADDKGLMIVTNDGYEITSYFLRRAYASSDETGRPAVAFELDPEGAKRLASMTGEHIGEQIAIIVDGEIYSAPVIRSQISSKGMISGLEDKKEADMLVRALESGGLKAPLTVEKESLVGPAGARNGSGDSRAGSTGDAI